jgi:hypothetical protein
MRENMKTYPHVRAMRHCLGCGGPKRVGWLVCEDCHNTAALHHDEGYGPDLTSLVSHAESQFDDDGRPRF